jgi:hypothetical protein
MRRVIVGSPAAGKQRKVPEMAKGYWIVRVDVNNEDGY